MQKKDFAQLTNQARSMEQLQEKGLEGMVDILSTVFSTIATVSPQVALDSLEQLNSQIDEIKKFAADRKAAHALNVKMLTAALPSMIEFEDDYDDEEEPEEEE